MQVRAPRQPAEPVDPQADRFGNRLVRSLWARAWGDQYPRRVQPFSSCTHELLEQLAAELDERACRRLADLGCGTGGPGLWLARRLRTRLAGVDRSAAAIAIARRRVRHWLRPGSAEFRVGDFSATGWEPALADAAISIDALPFARDPDTALAEIRRILRPPGKLLFTTRDANPASPRGRTLGPAWRNVLERNGFALVRAIERHGVSAAWRRLYDLWVRHERALRAELAQVTVDRLLAEVSEVGPRLAEDREWLLIVAERR